MSVSPLEGRRKEKRRPFVCNRDLKVTSGLSDWLPVFREESPGKPASSSD